VRVHDQLALVDVAALADELVDALDADHDDDASVEVDVDGDFDVLARFAAEAVVDAPDAPPLDVAPVAMHAPSTAVATTLAAPAAIRDRDAGRRRRRGWPAAKASGCSFMRCMMRTGGQRSGRSL
jgi:hypothetical protein